MRINEKNDKFFEDVYAQDREAYRPNVVESNLSKNSSDDVALRKKSFEIDQELVKSIVRFMQEKLSEEEFNRIAVSEVKDLFDDWCKSNDIEIVSSQKFNRTVESFFDRRRKNLSISKMNISEEKKDRYLKENVRMVSCWVRD